MTDIRTRLCATAVGLAAAGLFTAACSGDGGEQRSAAEAVPAAAGDSPAGRLIEATSPDGHALRDVPEDTAPSVRLKVTPDSESGWNVQVITEDYRFVPGRAGQQARGGEGHAHLYLDGKRIARIYGPWFHIPAGTVPDGRHELSTILTAHDHTAWATGGRPIRDTAEVTGRDAEADAGGEQDEHAGHDVP